MAGPLEGRVALVTGGARGLGEAIVAGLHADGATVLIGDVKVEMADALAERLGSRARSAALDVRRESDWARVVEALVDEFGRLDILVNNAGIGGFGPLGTFTAAAYERIVAVNQTGVFFGMRSAAPIMIKAGRGSIVNIASIDGLRGMPNLVAYCGSKHAVVGMSRAAALELAPFGIRVNSVCPGAMATPGLAAGLGPEEVDHLADLVPIGRLADPQEVARAIRFLASDESSYCTGTEITVDGGWMAGPTMRSPGG